MVSRSVILAVVVSAAGSGVLTGVASWFVMRPIACLDQSQASSSDQTSRRQAEDFFKSTAPPMTGGQQMRPRW
jgi:hypothetical protein